MASSLPIVAVLSATGNQGKVVVKTLSESSRYAVRALTRDPKSDKAKQLEKLANVTAVDTSDFDAAFKGVDVVYASTVTDEEETKTIKRAADAAQKAEVKLFIFSGLPSVKKETGGAITYVDHFERKYEAEQYLKTLKLPLITIYLSAFTDNFINFGLLKYNNDEFTMVMNMAGVETEHPMTYVSGDLGNAVLVILDNHEKTPSLFESPITVASYKIKFGDHAKILEEVTGRKVNVAPMDSFTGKGETDLDGMRKYYDEYGIFKGQPIPDARLTALGYKTHDFKHFVENVVVPTLL